MRHFLTLEIRQSGRSGGGSASSTRTRGPMPMEVVDHGGMRVILLRQAGKMRMINRQIVNRMDEIAGLVWTQLPISTIAPPPHLRSLEAVRGKPRLQNGPRLPMTRARRRRKCSPSHASRQH